MQNEFGKEVISVNDIEYEIGPCRHCGKVATETEALREFGEWRAKIAPRLICGACGKEIRIYGVLLRHCLEKMGRWRVIGASLDAHLCFYRFGGQHISIHEACARKILPFADWESDELSREV